MDQVRHSFLIPSEVSGKRGNMRYKLAGGSRLRPWHIGKNRNNCAAFTVLALDGTMTGDESLREQFNGSATRSEANRSAHINDRPSKRGAAALPQPFFVE